MGSHFILQGIILIQGLNPHLLCLLHWKADSLPLTHQRSPFQLQLQYKPFFSPSSVEKCNHPSPHPQSSILKNVQVVLLSQTQENFLLLSFLASPFLPFSVLVLNFSANTFCGCIVIFANMLHFLGSGLCVLHAKLLQACQTFCDSMDCSPPGSSVHGILQARIQEWVALSSFRESS